MVGRDGVGVPRIEKAETQAVFMPFALINLSHKKKIVTV
jgi:hypothetical protein